MVTIVGFAVLAALLVGILVQLNRTANRVTQTIAASVTDGVEMLRSKPDDEERTIRWEYWVETINTQYEIDRHGNIDNSPPSGVVVRRRLDDCGEDGWELVAMVPAAPNVDETGPANPYVFHALFKRAVQS